VRRGGGGVVANVHDRFRVRRGDEADNEPFSVEQGFDVLADLYYAYWGQFFHPALCDNEAEGAEGADLERRYERTHQRYFDSVRGSDAECLADLGCGGGALSTWMARRVRGEVIGIDLSARQIERAERRLRASKLGNLRFIRQDLLRLAELRETFDAAVCLDAACYLPDRPRALQQMAASLTAGGRLLLVDWCRVPGPTRLQRELILEPFYRAWGISDLTTVGEYRAAFRGAGLRLLDVDDLSAAVAPEWERGYRAALDAVGEPLRIDRLLQSGGLLVRHGPRVLEAAKAQFSVALLVKAAADSGILRYVSFLAERPR